MAPHPDCRITFKLTSYTPAESKVCTLFCKLELSPSPKFQSHWAIVSPKGGRELSVKIIGAPSQPFNALKAATGATPAITMLIVSLKMQLFVLLTSTQ